MAAQPERRGSIQASAGSSRRERGIAWLNLEVGHVHPGAVAISPGHGRQQQGAAGAERFDGGHGPPGEGSQAGRCWWPAAHGGRLQEGPREEHGVTDLQC